MNIDSETAKGIAASRWPPAHSMLVSEGWPSGAYKTSDEPVWAVHILGPPLGVGGDRVVVVSKASGIVLWAGRLGE